jgi:transcriptional regulator with GAF, ATPase, and Fis domain
MSALAEAAQAIPAPDPVVWVCGDTRTVLSACEWLARASYTCDRLYTVDGVISRLGEGHSELVILVDGSVEDVERLIGADPRVAIVVLLADPGVALVVRMMQAGARAVATTQDELVAQTRQQLSVTRPDTVRPLWTQSERAIFARIVNRSPAMSSIIERVRAVTRAPDTTVMILGESGTGKELVASAIHALSERADKPFITVDCGAIPESLFESELFGHERGSFTGAIGERKGRFELAHGGTIFLDEIGELPLPLQAKLLRVLEDRMVWRVGAVAPRPVDVRVITATNRELRLAVDEGLFRADLYFRLNVFAIPLPPLRERGADILHLAQHFFEQFNRELARGLTGFTPRASAKLVAHTYPGNVRELRNIIEAAVISASGPQLDAPDIALASDASQGTTMSIPVLGGEESVALRLTFGESALENLERAAVTIALERADGNQTRAARLLGIQRLALARAAHRLNVPVQRRKSTA